MRAGRDRRTCTRMRLDGLWLMTKGAAGVALVVAACVLADHALRYVLQ